MMELFTSDELVATFMPVTVYWLYSGLYEVHAAVLEKYRLHPRKEEDARNRVSKIEVVRGVLLQQALQTAVSLLVFKLAREGSKPAEEPGTCSLVSTAWQLFVAAVVMDAWQYLMHRQMHRSPFLYKHLHSHHHRLVVTYAFGAQYNHPLDGLLIETASGAAALLVSGMSARVSAAFFAFSTVKGVDDHCGYLLPWNPFHVLFRNNAAYHDVHHQLAGGKSNLSQPFFTVWDRLFGTYVPYSVEERPAGGFLAKAAPSD